MFPGVQLLTPPPGVNDAPSSSSLHAPFVNTSAPSDNRAAGALGRLACTLRHHAGAVTACALDFFLLERFEAQRSEMWRTLAETPLPAAVAPASSATGAVAPAAMSSAAGAVAAPALAGPAPAAPAAGEQHEMSRAGDSATPSVGSCATPPPSLFLYSWDDPLATASKVSSVIIWHSGMPEIWLRRPEWCECGVAWPPPACSCAHGTTLWPRPPR